MLSMRVAVALFEKLVDEDFLLERTEVDIIGVDMDVLVTGKVRGIWWLGVRQMDELVGRQTVYDKKKYRGGKRKRRATNLSTYECLTLIMGSFPVTRW